MHNNFSNRKYSAETEKEVNGFGGPKSLIETVTFKAVCALIHLKAQKSTIRQHFCAEKTEHFNDTPKSA